MTYCREFFELQLRFADRVAALSGLPREQVLLDYTNLYIRFGLGRDFNSAHPIWQDYLAGLRSAKEDNDWTHRFFLARPQKIEPPALVARFGCFSYARQDDDRIRLHFENAETDACSPLSRSRMEVRQAELRALFGHVRNTRSTSLQVVGVSWLYNLPAYRRLFPAPYVASARIAGLRFRNMPLWGQFLDRYGEVRPSAAALFRDRLTSQVDMESIAQCFPFQALAVEAPASTFYAFYGI